MGSVPVGDSLRGLRGFGEGPSSASSLVLDEEKGELVRANLVKNGRKGGGGGGVGRGGCDEKAAMALKMHSEAERRRRERINGHLAMLRSMVPCTDKKRYAKRNTLFWDLTYMKERAHVQEFQA